jgi:predicted O-methyltransferase YrrM
MTTPFDKWDNDTADVPSATSRDDRWELWKAGALTNSLPGAVVEIGSAWGRSALILAKACLGPIHCIDIWAPYVDVWGGSQTFIPLADFQRNLKNHGMLDRIVAVQSESKQAAAWWREPIRLLFVDGSHNGADAYHDIVEFGKFVIPEGVIVCHDYGIVPEVRDAIDRAAPVLGRRVLPRALGAVLINDRSPAAEYLTA